MLLFAVLALIDLRLAALAILLWLILNILMSRGSAYSSGRLLVKSRKTVYVSFSGAPEVKKALIQLSRGLRLIGGRVEPSQLIEMTLNLSRRRARHRGRRRMIGSSATIDYMLPRGKSFKVHMPATFRRSSALRTFPRVTWETVRARLTTGRAKASLIIILDSSASMMYSLRGILTALKAIEREARRFRDRVALIACKGSGAVVVQHPTTSFNLVLSKISRVGLSDFTPLASGMFLGLGIALTERRRGCEPVLIIVSDGNANVPLERRRVFRSAMDPAVQSVLEVAEQIARHDIETVVVNTKHREPMLEESLLTISGTGLLIKVARITRGSYVGVV